MLCQRRRATLSPGSAVSLTCTWRRPSCTEKEGLPNPPQLSTYSATRVSGRSPKSSAAARRTRSTSGVSSRIENVCIEHYLSLRHKRVVAASRFLHRSSDESRKPSPAVISLVDGQEFLML